MILRRDHHRGSRLKGPALRTASLLAGSVLYALGIVSFVRSAGLFPGGFSGFSLLVQELCTRYLGFTPPYSVLSITMNIIAAALCSCAVRYCACACASTVFTVASA